MVTSRFRVRRRRGRVVGFGEDVDAEVAALFGPFVVLLSQDGADQPDLSVRSGKMLTTSVRRRTSRFSRSSGLGADAAVRRPDGQLNLDHGEVTTPLASTSCPCPSECPEPDT
jgi:hypothetical protein